MPGSTGLTADRERLTIRAVGSGTVLTPRPEDLTGRWIDRGQPVVQLGAPDSVEIRVALTGPGSTLVRAGQPMRLFLLADGHRIATRIESVAAASAGDSGAVEVRVALPAGGGAAPGRDRRGQRNPQAV